MSIIERQKTILKIPAKYRAAFLPPPKSCKIELTSKCNYRCKFCALTLREKQTNKEMDFAFFKKITKQMKKVGVEEIGVFYIGESFTNPTLLLNAITYLKKYLEIPYVFLTSNASLAAPKYVKQCMEAGLDSLKWSCNVADNEQFESLIGVPTHFFDHAKTNIKDAFEIRNAGNFKCTLSASSIKYNDGQEQKMEEFLNEFVRPYVDEHYWLPLYSAGGEATQKEGELGYRPVAGNTGRVDDPSEPIPCWTLFTGAHVLVDGRLTGCCLDGSGKWVMGDLKTEHFIDAWNSPKFVELRKKHLSGDIRGTICEKCALV
jgi:MoaA/NifB/PqqE/SkfB family radical SAM enzyme